MDEKTLQHKVLCECNIIKKLLLYPWGVPSKTPHWKPETVDSIEPYILIFPIQTYL